jgi:hypothetical protein
VHDVTKRERNVLEKVNHHPGVHLTMVAGSGGGGGGELVQVVLRPLDRHLVIGDSSEPGVINGASGVVADSWVAKVSIQLVLGGRTPYRLYTVQGYNWPLKRCPRCLKLCCVLAIEAFIRRGLALVLIPRSVYASKCLLVY